MSTEEQARIGFVAPNSVSLVHALIAQIKTQPDVQAIEISYDAANPVMAHLCTQAGFQPTGAVSNGEIETRLRPS